MQKNRACEIHFNVNKMIELVHVFFVRDDSNSRGRLRNGKGSEEVPFADEGEEKDHGAEDPQAGREGAQAESRVRLPVTPGPGTWGVAGAKSTAFFKTGGSVMRHRSSSFSWSSPTFSQGHGRPMPEACLRHDGELDERAGAARHAGGVLSARRDAAHRSSVSCRRHGSAMTHSVVKFAPPITPKACLRHVMPKACFQHDGSRWRGRPVHAGSMLSA